jgi:hypothetical protein
MKTMKKNKNMKKYLLLLALIINLMPYIKDGEMKWTTTEAKAQLYIVESYNGLYGWLCVNTADDEDFFWSTTSACEVTDIVDEEDVINNGTVYGITICPTPVNGSHYQWCAFYTLTALKCYDACLCASIYYYYWRPELNIDGCNASVGVSPGYELFEYYTFMGVTFEAGVGLESEFIQSMSDNYHALLIGENHVYLIYQITVSNNKITGARKFDTADPSNDTWDNPIEGFDLSISNFIVSK